MAEKFSLSENELLYVWRRRLGLSQKDAAKQFNIDRYTYGLIELGRKEIPKNMIKTPENISDLEMCILLRRRKGWTQDMLGWKAYLSRTWIGYMEAGIRDPQSLIAFWESYND